MASEHSSSGPALHEMTHVSISSGLVPNPSPSTPFVPPSRSDWDLLFQPMFDESLNVDLHAPEVIALIPEAAALEHAVSTGSPSSTTVDQDAPSPSNSHTTQGTQTPIISHDVEEDNHDIEVATYGNEFAILWYSNVQKFLLINLLLQDVNAYKNVHPDHQVSEHTSKWTKDHPLENIIVETKKNLQEALPSMLIEAMQEELHEFEKRGLEPRGYSYGGEVQNGEDKDAGKLLIPSQYLLGPTEKHLNAAFADADHAGKALRYPVRKLNILLCPVVVLKFLWVEITKLTDYGFGFNKIPMYCDNKSAIALCCNNVQHSRSKHIDIRFHFIKEHVENGVIELYFVNTEYQLADIFTKALGRERIEFLINKLGMRSFTPDTLKQLADEVDE
ncbi:hypothetical protein Tco_0778867 [Tanacetum coccineum]